MPCQLQDFGHPAERTDDELEPEESTDSTGREWESDQSGSSVVKVTTHKMWQCLNIFQQIAGQQALPLLAFRTASSVARLRQTAQVLDESLTAETSNGSYRERNQWVWAIHPCDLVWGGREETTMRPEKPTTTDWDGRNLTDKTTPTPAYRLLPCLNVHLSSLSVHYPPRHLLSPRFLFSLHSLPLVSTEGSPKRDKEGYRERDASGGRRWVGRAVSGANRETRDAKGPLTVQPTSTHSAPSLVTLGRSLRSLPRAPPTSEPILFYMHYAVKWCEMLFMSPSPQDMGRFPHLSFMGRPTGTGVAFMCERKTSGRGATLSWLNSQIWLQSRQPVVCCVLKGFKRLLLMVKSC